MIITATEFKSKCLEMLDRANSGEVISITKRGKIVAELRVPYQNSAGYSGPGLAKGEMKIVGDIMEPIDVEWDALQ
jgi:antitoxin (DNA-binding transcriptional repressor) of toxin-antitoxin stability system